ncbi:retrovirus-related pol polyprotein from transposon TNT 1-94 [Tanacetum coccineum]
MAGDEPKKDVTDDVQLKGDNYDEWSRSFRMAIRARKKFRFIDETIKRPGEKDKDIEDWWTINSLLDDIKDRFSISNGPRIQQLKSDLAGCRQNGMTIVNYYGCLKQIRDELGNFDQIKPCTCGKCVCNLGAVFAKKQEEEKVHTFIMGLDESVYGTARSNILAQDPLPNLNKVYLILIQEERVNTMMRRKYERPALMALATQNRSEAKNRSVICTKCKKTRHSAENCFEIHGYPEWWGDRPRVDTKRNGAGRGLSSRREKGRGSRGTTRTNTVQIGSMVCV